MAGALLLALLVAATACTALPLDPAGTPPAGGATPASTPAAADAAVARPMVLAALDALEPSDLEAKAAALDRTPEELRAIVATSTAATFERDTGALRYRCDFGGRPGGLAGRRLVLPGQPEYGVQQRAADALLAAAAATADGLPQLLRPASLPEPGQEDPSVAEVFKLHRCAARASGGHGQAACTPGRRPLRLVRGSARPRQRGAEPGRQGVEGAWICAGGQPLTPAPRMLRSCAPRRPAAAPAPSTRSTWTSRDTRPRVRGPGGRRLQSVDLTGMRAAHVLHLQGPAAAAGLRVSTRDAGLQRPPGAPTWQLLPRAMRWPGSRAAHVGPHPHLPHPTRHAPPARARAALGTMWNEASCQDRNASLCYSPERAYPPSFVTPPFSMDADPAFSDAELAAIAAIWRGVAEDYVPFGVDVTTGGRARAGGGGLAKPRPAGGGGGGG